MKVRCNLCGETFDVEDLAVELDYTDITLRCPNGCCIWVDTIFKLTSDIEPAGKEESDG